MTATNICSDFGGFSPPLSRNGRLFTHPQKWDFYTIILHIDLNFSGQTFSKIYKVKSIEQDWNIWFI